MAPVTLHGPRSKCEFNIAGNAPMSADTRFEQLPMFGGDTLIVVEERVLVTEKGPMRRTLRGKIRIPIELSPIIFALCPNMMHEFENLIFKC